jgi:hypothetical protein
MSPEQLAINEACGNALAKANLQTKPQWVQDLVHANQEFANKARPVVMIGIAGGMGGTGAGAAEAGMSSLSQSSWAEASGILRSASRGKGNFGLGEATSAVDAQAGKAWVGEGARLASDGKTWVSSDGLRQWRPPTEKPRLGKSQSNYEERYQPSGQWQSNGHLDIMDLP